jgi:fucose 4-O-acetylase-like acetyltransferase
MVAGHVIGTNATSGLRVEDDSGWRFSFLLLDDVRMPLFAALSGFVYAMRPVVDRSTYTGMAKGKVRRLIVPLLTVGTLFVAFQILVPGTNGDVSWTMVPYTWVFGYVQFWFLQALFLIFLTVGLFDLFGLLNSPRKWLIVTGLCAGAFVLIRVPGVINVFSLDGALRLLPFFLLGYGLNRYATLSAQRDVAIVAAVFAAIGLTFTLVLIHVEHDPMALVPRSINVAFGMAVVYLLVVFRDRLKLRFLAVIGQFAFGIYLFHIFAAPATRMVLTSLGIDSNAVLFIGGLSIGIVAPTVFEYLFGRFPWISWPLLGQKPRRTSFRLPRRSGEVPLQVQHTR